MINFTDIFILFAKLIWILIAIFLLSVILFLIGKFSTNKQKQQGYIKLAKRIMLSCLLIFLISGGICFGGLLFSG